MKEGSCPIAIIGMSCVFPGADDVGAFWRNILAKADCVTDAPEDWGAEYVWDPEGRRNDKTYCKRGGFLRTLSAFDPSVYGVMPNAVDGTEPDHFLALRTAHEAICDAGYRDNARYRERTEVIIGRGTYVNRGNTTAIQHSIGIDSAIRVLKQLHPEYTEEELATIRAALSSSLPPFHADTAAGLVPNIISGRIANRLDLMGANYIIDAACASSLLAVEAGARDLQSGRCDMVVAGGVNASVPPVIMIIFSQLQALSRKGAIRPFSEEADGTLLSEGAGMMVLKRLDDAERDGDRIYAVLRGVGSASDGRALGLLAPRLEGEELALRRAYQESQTDPLTVGLVEAHGTATLVGDATEVEALKRVFGNGRPEAGEGCALGSVKSMIGHTMPAAGMAGLIKASLALHHKVLPPTIGCERPNPKLGIDGSRFYLNTELRPWIHGIETPRRAGVNAFGFGGINAHAVLEEYTGPNQAPRVGRDWSSELFVVSADTLEDLPGAMARAIAEVQSLPKDTPLRNLAWTWNCQDDRRLRCVSVIASGLDDLQQKLERAAAKLEKPGTRRIRDLEGIYFHGEPLGETGKVAFLFPGEGAQYRNMFADLCLNFEEAREWFDRMDRAFQGHSRGYLLSPAIFPPPLGEADERLWTMDLGAEAAFCANQAMYAVLTSCGVRPSAMIGHSTGEHSALLASGIVRPDGEAGLLRYIRGVNQVFENLKNSGSIPGGILMAVAGMEQKRIAEIVQRAGDGLFIALDNCPHQVVLFGTDKQIATVRAELASTSAICQDLPFGRAYHTPWFGPFAEQLRPHFQAFEIGAAEVPVYSCVTAAPYPSDPPAIAGLACQQWAHTVRFRETIGAMHADGFRIFIEAGAKGNLTAFLGDILRGKPHSAIACDLAHRPTTTQLQHALGELVAHRVPVNLARLYEARQVESVRAQKPAPRPRMKIAMGLQPAQLPPDFVLPSRPKEATAMAAAAGASEGVSRSADPRDARVPSPFVEPPSPLPPREAAVAAHLRTMEQFLQTQERIFTQYAQRRGGAKPAAPAAEPVLPFLTDVLQVVPGVRARVRHRFTTQRDWLFLDHTFGREVAFSDPTLTGLPVVPLTVTMEVLCEVASLLAPGQVVTGMRDLRASRWITVAEQGTETEIVASPHAKGGILVQLRPCGEGLCPVSAEAIVLFAESYPTPPAPLPHAFAEERSSQWTPTALYREGMFHGPAFQGVESMQTSASDGAVASLRVPSRRNLFEEIDEPRFLIDPVLLDAAGQAVAFWSQERLQAKGDIFPYRLAELTCYAPPAAAGTLYNCRVIGRHVGPKDMRSDIELRTGSGALHYRLTGWEDVRIQVPEWFWDFRIGPRTAPAGECWDEPVRHLGNSAVACARVDLPAALLEASHGIWAQVLAGLALSRQERKEFEALGGVPKRQNQWLLGRCAAKQAVRFLLQQQAPSVSIACADITIVAAPGGQPTVLLPAPALAAIRGELPEVSLAHSEDAAVAVASLAPACSIGIDLESLRQMTPDAEAAAFGAPDRQQLSHLPEDARHEWSLRVWCAKESLLKALGNGFAHGLGSVRLAALHPAAGIVELSLGDSLGAEHPDIRDNRIPVRTLRDDRWICSTAFVPRQGRYRSKDLQ